MELKSDDRRRKVDPEVAKQLYLAGNSCQEVAGVFSCRWETIQYHMKQLGVTRSRSEALKLAIGKAKAAGRTYGFINRDMHGEKNPNWKGGRIVDDYGYTCVWIPEERRYKPEHRIIWERVHNRPLPKGWCVHHINGINSDNRPENLLAMPTKRHDNYIPLLKKRIRELEVKVENLQRALVNLEQGSHISEN